MGHKKVENMFYFIRDVIFEFTKKIKMSKQNQSFHPRLLINEHFSNIINQIDVKTETLLENQILSQENRNLLNETREKQIEKIKEIEELNLNHLPSTIDIEKYEQKLSHILNNDSMDYQQKVDRTKEQEELIHFDCVLLEQPKNSLNGIVLWITSWFYNKENLEFLG